MANSYLILMFIMNIYLTEVSAIPMNQLISVIIFMIWNSTSMYSSKPSMTIHIFMLLIIMASGMMILMSYFISLSNMTRMKLTNFKYSYFLLNIVMGIFLAISLSINFYIGSKMFIYESENVVQLTLKLFNFPNCYIFVVTIGYMFLMLFLSSKMCFIKKKSLRNKIL